MKIAIFGRTFNPEFREYIVNFFRILQDHQVQSVIYKPFLDFLYSDADCNPNEKGHFTGYDDIPDDVDFMISIGGDGTFLESIMYLKSFNVPVIGINSGRLGFLANISKEEISEAFRAIIEGNYSVERRSLISLQVNDEAFGIFNFALNEVTVQKKSSAMITVKTYLNNEFLNSYWTDGLMVSTPTGSTAYSMSVGGPIVLPGSSTFQIVPIAPHNLTVRPLVIPDDNEIRLEVQSRSDNYLLTADHRSKILSLNDSTIVLKKAEFSLRMVKLPFNNYYSTLRNKLMWGADKRN